MVECTRKFHNACDNKDSNYCSICHDLNNFVCSKPFFFNIGPFEYTGYKGLELTLEINGKDKLIRIPLWLIIIIVLFILGLFYMLIRSIINWFI